MTATIADCRVILWEPQDPINVGSAVRACRNCDVPELVLVRPRVFQREAVLISAPGADGYVDNNVRVVDNWSEAVEGVQRVFALTARGRAERHARFRVEAAVDDANRVGAEKLAFVFGREDHGLPNQVIDRCDAYVTIETGPHSSLNLAQAVMVVAHRLFLAIGTPTPMEGPSVEHPPADKEQVERMIDRAEDALDAIGFFKGDQRENVLRTLRRIVRKADLDAQELATLFGIWVETARAAQRSD